MSGVAGTRVQNPPRDTTWQDRALCTQVGGQMFFPGKGDAQTTRDAKKLCRGCEVIGECLDYAIEHRERFGVWGGRSERERRKLMRANGVHDE